VAVAVLDQLRQRFGFPIDERALLSGGETATWPGRMQWIDGEPPLLIDGAHNPDGMRALVESLGALRGDRRTVVLFGVMHDKDIRSMVTTLRGAKPDAVIVTAPAIERAEDPERLVPLFGDAHAVKPVTAALAEARRQAGPDGLVVVCGSLYLVGETLTALDGEVRR
jgi:dihydrofolate synthase/folylpolyglutamate synthase